MWSNMNESKDSSYAKLNLKILLRLGKNNMGCQW